MINDHEQTKMVKEHGQTNMAIGQGLWSWSHMVEAIDKQTWSSLRQSALMRALAALDRG